MPNNENYAATYAFWGPSKKKKNPKTGLTQLRTRPASCRILYQRSSWVSPPINRVKLPFVDIDPNLPLVRIKSTRS